MGFKANIKGECLIKFLTDSKYDKSGVKKFQIFSYKIYMALILRHYDKLHYDIVFNLLILDLLAQN